MVRAWKTELVEPAAQTGLQIAVCRYPPGTSKWNRIEHRTLSFITMNWRNRPLTAYRTIIELISPTTTATGLTIRAERDTEWYAAGSKSPTPRWTPSPRPTRLARRLELHLAATRAIINHTETP